MGQVLAPASFRFTLNRRIFPLNYARMTQIRECPQDMRNDLISNQTHGCKKNNMVEWAAEILIGL